MTITVYIGAIIFAIGLFTWLFAASKLRGLQSSFVPVASSKIRLYQVVTWVGILLFIGGLLLSIFTFK